MARKADTPCAGGCGRLLWGGRGSLPAGVRCCRECRVAGRAPEPSKVPPPRPVRTCDVPECGRKHLARGLCSVHYKRVRADQGLDKRVAPVVVVGGVASLFGAYFPKPKPIKAKVAAGLLAFCPWCESMLSCTSPTSRYCLSCGTTVTLNEEEVSWVISERRSTAA